MPGRSFTLSHGALWQAWKHSDGDEQEKEEEWSVSDKKLLPASRFCGLIEMGEQKWLGHLFQSFQKEENPARAPLRSLSIRSTIICGMWVGCLLWGRAWG